MNEVQLTYEYLKDKLRDVKSFKDFRKLPEGIGNLIVVMNGEAMMFRREFYLHDPWLIIDQHGARIWKTREGYERQDESEVL